jgi:Tfp pilus assembly protein PilV
VRARSKSAIFADTLLGIRPFSSRFVVASRLHFIAGMTHDSSGFTLVEVIVAAGLLITVAVGAAHLFGFTIAQNQVSRQQLVMGLLAAAKVDELSSAIAGGNTVASAQETVLESGRPYARRWQIAPVPGYGSDALAVSVDVADLTRRGGEVRITTVRAVAP